MNPAPINPECGVMTLPPALPAKLPAAIAALQRTLERGGWTVETIDLDLHRDTARAEFRRGDGRRITFDARNGSACIVREHGSQFLGRTRVPFGARPALKLLCNYLADNGTAPMLASEVRNAMRIAMSAPRLLEVAS